MFSENYILGGCNFWAKSLSSKNLCLILLTPLVAQRHINFKRKFSHILFINKDCNVAYEVKHKIKWDDSIEELDLNL